MLRKKITLALVGLSLLCNQASFAMDSPKQPYTYTIVGQSKTTFDNDISSGSVMLVMHAREITLRDTLTYLKSRLHPPFEGQSPTFICLANKPENRSLFERFCPATLPAIIYFQDGEEIKRQEYLGDYFYECIGFPKKLTFDQSIDGSHTILIFHSDDSSETASRPMCKHIRSIIDEENREGDSVPNVLFITVSDQNRDLMNRYNVTRANLLPVSIFLRNRKEVDRFEGLISKSRIKDKIRSFMKYEFTSTMPGCAETFDAELGKKPLTIIVFFEEHDNLSVKHCSNIRQTRSWLEDRENVIFIPMTPTNLVLVRRYHCCLVTPITIFLQNGKEVYREVGIVDSEKFSKICQEFALE